MRKKECSYFQELYYEWIDLETLFYLYSPLRFISSIEAS